MDGIHRMVLIGLLPKGIVRDGTCCRRLLLLIESSLVVSTAAILLETGFLVVGQGHIEDNNGRVKAEINFTDALRGRRLVIICRSRRLLSKRIEHKGLTADKESVVAERIRGLENIPNRRNRMTDLLEGGAFRNLFHQTQGFIENLEASVGGRGRHVRVAVAVTTDAHQGRDAHRVEEGGLLQ